MSETERGKISVRIIVTTHKKYRIPDDPIYIPMQVGAAIKKDSRGVPLDLGYARDDIGDNISAKNPLYCELTGLYWAWKHMSQDYIGLVHYRRHFSTKVRRREKDPFDRILTRDDLRPLLGKYRIFVPAKRHYVIETLYSHYAHTHYVYHLYETRGIIARLCPEYLETYDRVLKHRSGHMFNMMIMDRQLLGEYCSWLFPILFALEQKVDVSNLSYFQGRYCGRVGEIIFNVWLDYQVQTGRIDASDICELPYIYTEKQNYRKKVRAFLAAKFLHRKYEG